MLKNLPLYTLLCLTTLTSYAQILKNIKSSVGGGFFTSTSNQNPFWVRANQYGTVPLESQIFQLRGNFKTEYDSTKNLETHKFIKKFDYAFGVELVGNVGRMNQFVLPEAYFKTRLGAFEFYAGRRREIVGLVDTALTSGSYIWSGNALPLPKIQISIPNYIPINRSGSIAVKGAFSHGWFGTQGIVQNFYLHQKYFYARFGKPSSKLKFYTGFNHHVQWGGRSEKLSDIDWGIYDPTIKGKLAPYPWYSYQFVVIPFLQKLVPINSQKVPGYDSGLAIGNHLGSAEIAFDYKTKIGLFSLYHQKPYDFARSLYNFNNIEDGLNGFSVKLNKSHSLINSILIEFLYTKSQGRERFGKIRDSNYGEVDNYFSHGQYQNGWSYNSNIIGTPFISTENYLQSPRTNYLGFVTNNRVKAIYLGLYGYINPKTTHQVKLSYSNNFGLYGLPLSSAKSIQQFSSSIAFNRDISIKQKINLIFAYDTNGLFKPSLGTVVNYTYNIR